MPSDQGVRLSSALFTDLYELTMAQAYEAERMDQMAVFELAFRELPKNRNYVVAAGFEDVVHYLSDFQFTAGELEYLRQRQEQLENGVMVGDVIGRFDEQLPGEPRLQPLWRERPPEIGKGLHESRSRLQQELKRLPHHLHKLESATPLYRVSISERLRADFEKVRAGTRPDGVR